MFRYISLLLLGIFLIMEVNAKLIKRSDYKVREETVVHQKQGAPHEINYQGWLGSADDTTGVTGTFNMTFRLYTQATGGTPVWEETHTGVEVSRGVFNIILGSVNPIPADIFTGVPLWLELQVGNEPLSPRKKLVSVGYAIRAENAKNASYADTASYIIGANVVGEVAQANHADTADYALNTDTANYVAGANVSGEVAQANHADTADYALNANVGYVDSASVASNAWKWANHSWGDALYVNNVNAHGIYVGNVDSNGVYVDSAGYDGVRVRRANVNGFYVGSAVNDGFNAGNVGDDGVSVWSADDDGIYVHQANSNGIQVDNADDNGVYIANASTDGFKVGNAGNAGLYVGSADYGVRIATADTHGIYVQSTTYDGLYVNNADDDGIDIHIADDCGLYVGEASDGVYVDDANNRGVYVDNARYGIYVHNITDYGVWVWNAGVDGIHVDNATGDGIDASGTTYAGYFRGDVAVTGEFTAGTKLFVIDHPLDPENKLLRHSCVESPENLCLYRGKAKLDATGAATVKMPDYFVALTKEDEATVNLTPIGRPFLTGYEWNSDYTAFTIYGEPNREVAYIVLADRDDPVIRKLRKPVVQDKSDSKLCKPGELLYPAAYGYPKEYGKDYREKIEKLREIEKEGLGR